MKINLKFLSYLASLFDQYCPNWRLQQEWLVKSILLSYLNQSIMVLMTLHCYFQQHYFSANICIYDNTNIAISKYSPAKENSQPRKFALAIDLTWSHRKNSADRPGKSIKWNIWKWPGNFSAWNSRTFGALKRRARWKLRTIRWTGTNIQDYRLNIYRK